MNKLLFDEAPLVVQPTLASIIGLNEAIILQQIHYWVKKSKDGWIYNTYDQWQKQFPFYSEATIKRTITSLKKRGVVIVEQRSKSDWNRVNHYTIDYEVMNRLTESNCDDRTGQNDLIESSKMTSSFYKTENTTETTTDIKSQANALFDLFYQAYPKKKAKQDALKAWIKLNPDQELIKEILSKLVMQKQTLDWTKDNGKFIPNPATYLNGRRWEDEISVDKKSFNDMTASDLADYWG